MKHKNLYSIEPVPEEETYPFSPRRKVELKTVPMVHDLRFSNRILGYLSIVGTSGKTMGSNLIERGKRSRKVMNGVFFLLSIPLSQGKDLVSGCHTGYAGQHESDPNR